MNIFKQQFPNDIALEWYSKILIRDYLVRTQKFSEKTNISYSLIRTLAYVLNKWTLMSSVLNMIYSNYWDLLLSRNILVQSWQWKYQNKVWNLSQVNNKETKILSLLMCLWLMLNIFHKLFWCFHGWLWTSKCQLATAEESCHSMGNQPIFPAWSSLFLLKFCQVCIHQGIKILKIL